MKAIECYSRSIALQPTAVAFANRAMALLKIRRSHLLKHFLFLTAQRVSIVSLLYFSTACVSYGCVEARAVCESFTACGVSLFLI